MAAHCQGFFASLLQPSIRPALRKKSMHIAGESLGVHKMPQFIVHFQTFRIDFNRFELMSVSRFLISKYMADAQF